MSNEINAPGIDFLTAAQMGLVNGWDSVFKFGESSNILATEVGISPTGYEFVWPTAATLIQLSSTSVADAVAGIGAEKVLVLGLDADGVEISEEIELTGTSASTSTLEFYRINRMYVTLGELNVGTIWASPNGAALVTGAPADSDKLYEIGPNNGQTTQLQYTVPANRIAYIYDINLGLGGDKTVKSFLRTRTTTDSCFRNQASVYLFRQAISYPIPYLPIPPMTDMMGTAVDSTPAADIAGTWSMLQRVVS
jgi:hypothetical protein